MGRSRISPGRWRYYAGVSLFLVGLALVAVALLNSNPTSVKIPIGKTATGPVTSTNGQITVIAPAPTGHDLPGMFVWVSQTNLWLGGTSSGGKALTVINLGGRSLFNFESLALANDPSFSPDATQVYYAYSPPPEGQVNDLVVGQDLWVYNLKTSQKKRLLKRPTPLSFLAEPVPSLDGKSLYYSYRTPIYDNNNVAVDYKTGIERLNLDTGQHQPLVENAHSPGPSRDGKYLAYVHLESNGSTSLNMLDLSTGQSKVMLTQDQGFVNFLTPRFSPVSDQLVFSGGVGPALGSARQPSASTRWQDANTTSNYLPMPMISRPLEGATFSNRENKPRQDKLNAPPLHNLPYDLWIINRDGSGLRRLTRLYEDLPLAAWSKNGQQIAMMTGLAFYTIDLDGQNLTKLADRGAHNGFDWKDQP